MAQQYGSVVAKIVTSSASVPVEGAALTITQKGQNGGVELLAVRMSDESGFTEPFYVQTPNEDESQQYQTENVPYALVDLQVDRYGYDPIAIRGAQIFANTQTLQPLILIPTSELPDSYARETEYTIPAQTI